MPNKYNQTAVETFIVSDFFDGIIIVIATNKMHISHISRITCYPTRCNVTASSCSGHDRPRSAPLTGNYRDVNDTDENHSTITRVDDRTAYVD